MKSFLKSFFSSVIGTIFGVFFALTIIPLVIVLVAGHINWNPQFSIKKKAVLHVLLDGEVVDSTPSVEWLFEEGHSKIRLQRLIKAIRNAREDQRVVGAVLDIRNPQMGWAAATAIRRELEAFKESKKFVYAYSDRLNEMGFYLASSAEKTYMQPHGDVELDGMAAENPFLKGLFAKLEVKPIVFRVGKFKSAVEPFLLDKMSPENREQLTALIGDLWGEARAAIASRASVKPAQLDQWMDELSIQSVEDAKKYGLITDVLYSDEFDDLVHEKAQWDEDQEPNYVSIGQMAQEGRSKHKEKKKIALLIAEGEIVKGEGGRGQVGDDTYLQALQEIQEDDSIAAVVLRVNSPGGDALASDILWRELAVVDEERPVVASMGDVAASGGYYISAGARHIVAEPTTITGSIGVFGLMFNAQDLFKNKLGVVFDRVTTHKHSDYGGMTRTLDPKESGTIQAAVERTYTRFIQVVAESRGFEKTEDVNAIAEGRVWSGTRALKIGLVDELGGLDRALSKAAEFAGIGDGYEIEVFPKNADRLSRFLEQLSEESVTSSWLSPFSPWIADFIKLLAKVPSLASKLSASLSILERVQTSGRPAILARDPMFPSAIR